MWCLVLWLAFTATQDPVRIGITGLLMGRKRPVHNLFAYWLGLLVMGFGFAMVALFLARDFALSVQGSVAAAFASPIVPPIQMLLGVLALAAATRMVLRTPLLQAVPAPMAGGDAAVLVLEAEPPKPPTRLSRLTARLSWTSALEGKSVGMSFVAGLCTSTQLLEFSGAMVVIATSRTTVLTQISAALVFTVLTFAIVEIPLICYLIAPSRTQFIFEQFHGWLSARRRPITIFLIYALGVILLMNGLGKL